MQFVLITDDTGSALVPCLDLTVVQQVIQHANDAGITAIEVPTKALADTDRVLTVLDRPTGSVNDLHEDEDEDVAYIDVSIEADPLYGYDVQGLRDLAQGDLDAGTEPLDLDDDVHDAASRVGSDVNNGGTDSQVDYLVRQLGYFGAQTLVDDRARQQR